MRIRRFRTEDAPILAGYYDEAKHGPKPVDFEGIDMAAAFVLLDENDVPRAALGGRRTVEMQLVMDSDWETPAVRMAALRALSKDAFKALFTLGFRGAHCWLDETIVRPYSRRLHSLGMVKEARQSFRIEVQ